MTLKKILVVVALIVGFSTIVGAAGGGLPQLGLQFPSPDLPGQTERGPTGGGDAGTTEGGRTEPRTPRPDTARPDPADPKSIVIERQAILLLNPATVMAGSAVNVSGSGFEPGATIDMYLKRIESDKGEELGFVQADQTGGFGGFSFMLPEEFAGRTFLVVAEQHDGKRRATAQGNSAANSPVIRFGTQVGQPGDTVTFSARGFVGSEQVRVHFNSLNSEPVATFQMDPSGGLLQETVTVPFGAVGNNSFIFIGEKSQSPVTVPFLMLNLYPNAVVSSYAAKADSVLTFTGEGFGPGERVSVHLNDPAAPPVAVLTADATGSFEGTGAFLIPFGIEGKNTFILRGEQSQTATTVGFDVLPYSPFAEPSTYGGRPGTTVTFYGSGFARNEIVRVFAGATRDNPGREVACFRADDRGDVRGGGSYTVPSNVQPGTLNFRLVGDKSKGVAVAAIEVMDAGGPLQSPPEEQEYSCPLDAEPAEGGQPQPAPQAEPAPAVREEVRP